MRHNGIFSERPHDGRKKDASDAHEASQVNPTWVEVMVQSRHRHVVDVDVVHEDHPCSDNAIGISITLGMTAQQSPEGQDEVSKEP